MVSIHFILLIFLSVCSFEITNITIPNTVYYPPAIRPFGDLDRDGFDDFMLCKSASTQLTVYFGSSLGVNQSNPFTQGFLQFRTGVVGDFKGDGFADVLLTLLNDVDYAIVYDIENAVTAETFPTISYQLTENSSHYGTDVIAIDFNGDDTTDAVIGAEFASLTEYQEGALIFHEGSPSGLAQNASGRIYSNSFSAQFARSIVSGDVNGDQIEDIIVGFANYSVNELNEGAVAIYFGGKPFNYNQSPMIIASNISGEFLGQMVAAGDMNGDHNCDIVAISNSQVWLFLYDPVEFIRILYSGPAVAVASGHDLDGDGTDDFIITTLTQISIYHGNLTGIPTLAKQIPFLQSSPYHYLNFIGDIDGDGVPDFAVLDPGPLDSRMMVFTKYRGSLPSPTPTSTPSTSTTPSNSAFPSTTATPSGSASSLSSDDTGVSPAAVAGGAAGGSGCLIIVVVAAVFWFRKKNRKDHDDSTSEEEEEAQIELSN